MKKITFALALLLTALAPFARGQEPQTVPTGGVSLLPADPLAALLPPAAQNQDYQIVPVTGQPFTQALRLRTRQQPKNAWDNQLSLPLAGEIKKGDTLFATFRMRVLDTLTGYGRTDLVLEDARTYDKSIYYSAAAMPVWKQFQIPVAAPQDEPMGAGILHFHLGFTAQTIEIADIHLTDYGPNLKVADFPVTTLSYEGREPDAPWRKAAAARIERIRKGNLRVVVRDASGKPVPDAGVQVRMTRHAFAFGSALDNVTWMPTPDAPYAARYRQETYARFNKATVGDALKWNPWEGTSWSHNAITDQWHPYTKAGTIKFVQTLRAHGIAVRGHNLVWPSWGYLPKGAEDLKANPPALAKLITDHITEEMTAMKGLCTEWDVMNEPYGNHDVMDVLGNHAMVDWFRTAHAIDPKARLFVNDNGIMESNGEDVGHANAYEATIKYLLDNGAPLGGIGMEGHYSQVLTPPTKILAFLDRFGKFGLPIQTTEFDTDTPDEALQSDYMRDYMTATFSHPAVSGFVMWGFWEGDHDLPHAAPWRKDWTVRPNGKVWTDLVFHQWWTNAAGRTDQSGVYQTRGFLGDYQITVTHAGRAKTIPAHITKNGDGLSVVTVAL